MGWIEWTATVFGIAYVLLMIRRNIMCWVAGNISVALQAISFFNTRLYADMLLQGVYFVLGCYGFWVWWKKRSYNDALQITHVKSERKWLTFSLIWAIGSIVWALVLRLWTNAFIPELDATLATASLIATWMQAHRYIENWLLWIGVDIAYAAVYSTRGLWLYVGLYGIFAILAWRGWKQWQHLLDDNATAS